VSVFVSSKDPHCGWIERDAPATRFGFGAAKASPLSYSD
jgi:hypothetical protein